MQIVGYDSLDGGLYVSDADGVGYVPLDAGAELEYALGARRCAGTVHDDTHISCSNAEAPYCPDHRRTWVCARCRGTCLKDEMDCHETHAIYLAAFAPDLFKVGVTREWRLETRLREQGADRAAHIQTVSDGRIARRREAEIATRIPDRIRVPAKRAALHRSVDEDAWNALCERYDPIERFTFDYGFDLDSQPVAETMATGTVRGTKGRLLLLDRGGTTYAVDLRDLVGYELSAERTERELQSSLGAFG
ncbi:DUF2797 domain-containing protein [Haloferacaceae archaeon DSL9]